MLSKCNCCADSVDVGFSMATSPQVLETSASMMKPIQMSIFTGYTFLGQVMGIWLEPTIPIECDVEDIRNLFAGTGHV